MNASYRLGWIFFRALFTTYFRWRVYHPERVPLTGPVILAANHASYIDPPLIGAALPRQINFLARSTLFRFPLLGSLLRSWNAVGIDRDGGSGAGLKAILERLRDGGAVILFPEGTRTRDGKLKEAEIGIGLLAVKTGAPIVPVRVFGTFEAYGRHMRFPRPRKVAVKYGRAMTFDSLVAEAASCSKPRLKLIYQEIANEIMEAIARIEPGADD